MPSARQKFMRETESQAARGPYNENGSAAVRHLEASTVKRLTLSQRVASTRVRSNKFPVMRADGAGAGQTLASTMIFGESQHGSASRDG
jgi:hypothetical protein